MNKQHPIPFDKVNITGGFWKDRIALNESVTLDSVRRRFEDTGRFSALSCEWKQGEPDRPHFFYDSDAAVTTTNYTAPDILSKRRSPTMKPRASADSLI